MKVTDGKTQSGVDLKPSIGSGHGDARRLERIVLGKQQHTVIEASWGKERGGGTRVVKRGEEEQEW